MSSKQLDVREILASQRVLLYRNIPMPFDLFTGRRPWNFKNNRELLSAVFGREKVLLGRPLSENVFLLGSECKDVIYS